MAISGEANEWLQILYIFFDFVCNSCELCMSKIKESLLAISISKYLKYLLNLFINSLIRHALFVQQSTFHLRLSITSSESTNWNRD